MNLNHLLYGSAAFSGAVLLAHSAAYPAIRGGILFILICALVSIPVHGVVTLIQVKFMKGELEPGDSQFSFAPSALGIVLLLLAIALGVWTA